MVHVEAFNSTEEMVEYLRANSKTALDGLHPVQAALTYGDHWVQFYDLDKRIIIFGRVVPLEEVALNELHDGADWDSTLATVMTFDGNLSNGMMYAESFSIEEVVGSYGNTHKAHAWPIEERLFDMAKEVEWDITKFDDTARVLLNIAFAGMKAHLHQKAES